MSQMGRSVSTRNSPSAPKLVFLWHHPGYKAEHPSAKRVQVSTATPPQSLGGFDFVILAGHCPFEEKFTTRLVCLGLSRNDSDVWWDTPAISVDMQLFCSICGSKSYARDRTRQSTTSHKKKYCILRGFGSKVLEVGVFINNKVPPEDEAVQLYMHHLRSGPATSEVHTVTCRVTVSFSNVTRADTGQRVPFQNNPDLSHAHVLLQGHDSDETVLAQRSVLTAHSEYFQAMFRNNDSNESLVEGQPIVKLKAISVGALRIAIGHMYGKDLPVRLWDSENWENLFELWTFSTVYLMNPLKEDCEYILRAAVTSRSIGSAFLLAKKLNNLDVMMTLGVGIVRRHKAGILSEVIVNFTCEDIKICLGVAKSALDALDLAERWIASDSSRKVFEKPIVDALLRLVWKQSEWPNFVLKDFVQRNLEGNVPFFRADVFNSYY
jgi:BTB/POZ domain